MASSIRGVTLKPETIKYIEHRAKIEKRNFSNMVDVIITRYKQISEQLDQGAKFDVSLTK